MAMTLNGEIKYITRENFQERKSACRDDKVKKKSGVALTQLSLTLHSAAEIFIISTAFIQKLYFSCFVNE